MVAGGGFVAVPMYVVMVWDGVQHASEGFFFLVRGLFVFSIAGRVSPFRRLCIFCSRDSLLVCCRGQRLLLPLLDT